MMTPEQLKNSILQRAIEGKLVPQIAGEGTGAELLEEIRKSPLPPFEKGGKGKQKAKAACPLCKEGKPLAVGDFPFDIPKTWAWCRLGEICDAIGDGIHGTPHYTENGKYYFINGSNLQDGHIIITARTLAVDKVEYEKYKKPLNSNTILISINGTIGNTAFYNDENIILGKSACYIALDNNIDKNYIRNFFLGNFFLENVTDKATQTTIKNVPLKAIREFPIPLPPLAEQKRIVAKLEEILPLVDEYAEAYNKLQTLNSKFPTDLKKALLQYAMEGKLVPCDTSKWKQVKLGDVCEIARGGSPRPIKDYLTEEPNGINWIKIGDAEIGGKYISSTKEKIKPEGMKKSRFVHKGDFLLTNSMSYGRPYILKVDGCIHDGWLVLSQKKDAYDINYLYWLLSSDFVSKQFNDSVAGAVVKNLNSDKVAMVKVTLPPLAEQKRIVAKLEELLPLCEEIE